MIVAHPAAEQVYGALRASAEHIGSALEDLTNNVIIDIGHFRPGSPALALAAYADHVVILSDPSLEAVVSLTNRARIVRGMSSVHIVLTASNRIRRTMSPSLADCRVGVIGRAEGRRGETARDAQVKTLLRDLGEPNMPKPKSSLASLLDTDLDGNG